MSQSNSRQRAKRLSVEDRRAQLIEIGKKIFSERAYDEISTDELARLAGVSTGLMYHYFPSKRAYYLETVRSVGQDIVDAMAFEPGRDIETAVRRALDTFVDFVDHNTALYRTVIQGGIGADEAVLAVAEEVRSVSITRILDRLGLGPLPPAVALRLRGWRAFGEHPPRSWVESKVISREELIEMQIQSLNHHIASGVAT